MAGRDDMESGERRNRGNVLVHGSRTRARVLSSLIAGQLAGLVMLLLLMVVDGAVLHRSPVHPLQLIGALLLGARHLSPPDGAALVVGILFHQLVPVLFWSLVYGGLLAISRHQLTANEVLLLGFFIGGVSEIVDSYLVMPHFQRAVNGYDLWARNVPQSLDWASHIVFGLAMGGFYLWVRRRARWHAEAAPRY